MQKLQLEGFKPIFYFIHLLPSHNCHIHSGVVEIAKMIMITIKVILAVMIFTHMLNTMDLNQVPYETAKFCQDCGLVKEPYTLATDIAFQVDDDYNMLVINILLHNQNINPFQ